MSKFYVTTSIPYVNAKPHIGFAMELIQADVLARYHRQIGDAVLFSTGTDEHGSKIAEKAQEAGIAPKDYADEYASHFKDLIATLNVSNDKFIRTTDKDHENRVQKVWQNLKGSIYKNNYIGLYCVGCEEFVTEQHAKENNNICPVHNRPYQQIEEENYFFSLSKFTAQIKKAIVSDEFKIIPNSRKNEMLALIDSGLEDISISRSTTKLSWGVPVPGDQTQVMYVWFDALLNYISILGYPDSPDFANFWPADVQVIGKDILRFHAAIWPGILIALGLPLPKKLYVHGFITSGGQKMSKSLGNVIEPNEVVSNYGVDTLRYFCLRHISSYGDGDFNWERLKEVYNNELANELGNAVGRISAMIGRYQNNIIGDIPAPEHDIHDYEQAIADCRFDLALEKVWEQVRGLNQYIDAEKPWEVAKTGDEQHLQEVLAYCVGNLLQIAELLAPFMPDTSAKIANTFKDGIVRSVSGPLFPKFD
jgi:methionyl-tRNA synthetase